MNEQELLKMAKASAKRAGCPSRTPVKNFLLALWSEIYLRLLWVGMKLHVVSFYTWEAYCFNREYFLDSDGKGQRAL